MSDKFVEIEKKHHDEQVEEDKLFDAQIKEIYSKLMDELDTQINAWFQKYADENGITMAEAKKRANKLDIEAYSKKAKEYVKNKDFTDKANQEMSIYNLTMKTNRLQLLEAQMELEMAKSGSEVERFIDEKLEGRAIDEIERQAGILGDTVNVNKAYLKDLINNPFYDLTYDERLWTHQELMDMDIKNVLAKGFIQGKNPRSLISQVRDKVNATTQQIMTLLNTEMARVQTGAQMESFRQAGFDMYTFHSLGSGIACKECFAINGKHFKVDEAEAGVNCSPMHPNCRCSASPYMNTEEFDDWLDHIDEGMTWEEWKNEFKNGKINIEIDAFVPCLRDAKTGKILQTEAREIVSKK